ncbi:hypothetical protein ASE69_17880 [Sphingomonas sp. Leaf208]|uniref:hypothetical protein n=1 Tax=Sphingomonas sp. Leaf208 TaxID=1735679 RepID=UPI0006F536B6|nr:hypothetical protein [Sphingomonas sp. Leaf208]KQM54978.1 hypothetical protein ASE69_17880 [Sphingomonas sp. Leaf208]
MLDRLQQAAMAAEGNLAVTLSLNIGGAVKMTLHMADELGVLATLKCATTFVPWTSIKYVQVEG